MFRQIREDECVHLSALDFSASPAHDLHSRRHSPHIPTSLSPELQHLLAALLDKDPLTRPSLPSLWSDPWLTSSGADPLPSYETNVASPIADPSSDEVDHALAAYRGSAFLAMSAAAKFKGLLSAANVRRASSNTSVTPPTSPPPAGSGPGPVVMVDSPELVDSPVFSASPVGSPPASPSPPRATTTTTQQPGAHPRMRRREPRQQTTMSSLSLGSRWASVDDEGPEEGAGRDEEAEVEEGRGEANGRERSGSPTPRPPSPSPKAPVLPHFESEGGVVYGGAETLTDDMAAAGISRPAREGEGDADAGEWDEPE